MYPIASRDASFVISVLSWFVTFLVSRLISSGHSAWGSSAQAMWATHWAAERSRVVSVPRLSSTYSKSLAVKCHICDAITRGIVKRQNENFNIKINNYEGKT